MLPRAATMNYSVTGITDPPDKAVIWLCQLFAELPEPEVFNTGGAAGIDTMACVAGLIVWPNARHRILHPAYLAWNETELRKQATGFVEFVPIEGSYMDRNDALVAACDLLLAYPRTDREQLRSGTWATIRRARKARKMIIIHPLT